MSTNLIAAAIPPATLQKAVEAAQLIRQLLGPYLISLTPEERATMPKMGDKSLAFVTEAAEFGVSLKSLLPAYLSTDDLVVDAGVAKALLPLFQLLDALTLDVDSTRMEAGSEGYVNALLVYGGLQAAAAQNQPGAQAAVAQLSPRFEGQRKRKAKGPGPLPA